ncbi:cohesin domain-containing protein [Geomonas sp.]|uniref:cohesin domain-containing protein n=1 Tax=Geomonas sp. TaxID=2651584 RepID=UPI002B48E260|nr:cohesin domain-containing protein [Geomonas sp.]HJV36698.1 cohesin domain-containing protein [Geomonas sp.]
MKLEKLLKAMIVLVITAFMWGCGGGGGGAPSTPATPATSLTIVSSGGGQYSVQGNNLNGVAALEFNLVYDSSTLSSPTVTQGDYISGALFESNALTPGTISFYLVSTTPFSGTGQIAKVSFAEHTGTPAVTVTAVKMYNLKGDPI